MNKMFTKFGAVLAFVLLASGMQVSAAEETGTAAVYFMNNGWYQPYFQIKTPSSPKYVEAPKWDSGDGSGLNENLPNNTLVCVAVRTGGVDERFRPWFKNYIFNVTKQGEHSFLYFYGPSWGSYYGFGGPHGAGNTKEDEDAQRDFNKAGLSLVKTFDGPSICSAS